MPAAILGRIGGMIGPAALRALNDIRMGFLIMTRVPVGTISGPVPTMGASAWTWPLIGAVVGGISALVWGLGLHLGLPPLPAAALAILAAAA